jgi:hypothetical protein
MINSIYIINGPLILVHSTLPAHSLQNALRKHIQKLTMSQLVQAGSAATSTSVANGLTGYNCTNCRRFTKFKVVQSNANGNRGRLMAMVWVYLLPS